MNSKIVYGVVFGVIFLMTTAVIIYMNSMYTNIFKFDFNPNITLTKSDSLKLRADSLKVKNNLLKADSLKADSLKRLVSPDSIPAAVIPDKISLPSSIEKPKAKETTAVENNQPLVPTIKNDSSYATWVKKTAAFFELMDPKKAAKIIQKYSDNEARDILYTLKKKKAAEILAEISPDVANRITRIN